MPAQKRNYQEVNSKTWDNWVKNGIEWSIPITHNEYMHALKGDWGVYLTPSRHVPKEWFPDLKHADLLGLASGGGQQMPIFSALGAKCTVFDNSDSQLERERMVSEREGYAINLIKGDMTKRLPFDDDTFDIIFHPVSNCYIEDVYPVWRECFRVLKRGGVLLAGMNNGINFLFEDSSSSPLTIVNKLPVNPVKNATEAEYKRMVENDEGIEFSHSLEEQLGGQLKAGLILTDLFEDRDRKGSGILREYTPQYIATRAIKP